MMGKVNRDEEVIPIWIGKLTIYPKIASLQNAKEKGKAWTRKSTKGPNQGWERRTRGDESGGWLDHRGCEARTCRSFAR